MTDANLCFAMLLTEYSLRFAWQGHENNTTRDVCISQMEGEGALHCKQLETAGGVIDVLEDALGDLR